MAETIIAGQIGILDFEGTITFETAITDLASVARDKNFLRCFAFMWDFSKAEIELTLAEMQQFVASHREIIPAIERPRKVAMIATTPETRTAATILCSLLRRQSESEYQVFEHERTAKTWLVVRRPRTDEQIAVA